MFNLGTSPLLFKTNHEIVTIIPPDEYLVINVGKSLCYCVHMMQYKLSEFEGVAFNHRFEFLTLIGYVISKHCTHHFKIQI